MKRIVSTVCVPVVMVLFLAGCGSESGNNTAAVGDGTKTGSFQSVHGQTGKVSFGVVFSSPPNVTLKAGKDGQESSYKHPAFKKTVIVETTTEGFKWKNSGKADDYADGEILWEAVGK
ncbi:MAG: hypothetical protein LC104_13330 [Bacteroidales bacterium]|nr:hypothetical protein [Bacteroidales bacterium]